MFFLHPLVVCFVTVFMFSVGNCELHPELINAEVGNAVYQGRVERVLGRKVAFFLGIRYAEPPFRERRFKKPVPARDDGILSAVEYSATCFQWRDDFFGKGYPGVEMWNANTKLSEDCLYLNVWSPIGSWVTKTMPFRLPLLPVMVWIYGGGFYSGTASLDVYKGQWLAAAEQVVVVSMNYRVAALGFLSLGTDDVPGNAGLWDQREALIWVNKNIRNFGGDPSRVTLFGESAGAASVSLHMLSQKSKGLFQNAILQSASAFSPWAVVPMHIMKQRANALIKKLGCSDESGEGVVFECMYNKDPQDMVDTEINMADLGTSRFQNAAVVDEDFLTTDDIKMLENGSFTTEVNILSGFNKNEGNYFLIYGTEGYRSPLMEHLHINLDQYRRGLVRGLQLYPWRPLAPKESSRHIERHQEIDLILHAIDYQYGIFNLVIYDGKNQYFYGTVPPPNPRYDEALDRIVGDVNFVCPIIRLLRICGAGHNVAPNHEDHGNRFLYKFLHRSSQTPWPEWMGTLHGYEIEFVFGIPLDSTLNYTAQEKKLSRLMMHYWASFARTGDPNSDRGGPHLEDTDKPKWPAYDEVHEMHISLDTEEHLEATNGHNEDGHWNGHNEDGHGYNENGHGHDESGHGRNGTRNWNGHFLRHDEIDEEHFKFCSFWNDYYPIIEWEMIHVRRKVTANSTKS